MNHVVFILKERLEAAFRRSDPRGYAGVLGLEKILVLPASSLQARFPEKGLLQNHTDNA